MFQETRSTINQVETLMRLTISRKFLYLLIITIVVAVPVLGQTGQSEAPAAKLSLRVSGEVEKQLTLGAEDLSKLPRRSVRVKDHDGKEAEYEGSHLIEV